MVLVADGVQIQAGYFSSRVVTDELVKQTKGRGWGEYLLSLSALDFADHQMSEDVVH